MPIAVSKNVNQSRVIKVPVSSYVAKVMRRLYGQGVIHVPHNTLRGKAVANVFTEVPDELEFPERTVPQDVVEVELNYRVARYYKKWNLHRVFELGIYYEKIVQRMLLTHIIAQVRCKQTINAAIDDFFNLYNIDEDDYARETALMIYHKYKKQFNL